MVLPFLAEHVSAFISTRVLLVIQRSIRLAKLRFFKSLTLSSNITA